MKAIDKAIKLMDEEISGVTSKRIHYSLLADMDDFEESEIKGAGLVISGKDVYIPAGLKVKVDEKRNIMIFKNGLKLDFSDSVRSFIK